MGKCLPCRSSQNFYQPSILCEEVGPRAGHFRGRGREVTALTRWVGEQLCLSLLFVVHFSVCLASFSSVLGWRPVATEFSLLSLQMEREGLLKTTEERAWEEG